MASNKSEKDSGNQDADILGIKELSITPVITSLLKPTSDLIGIELRDYVKEKIDDLKKKKRVENVVGHIHHAQEVLQKERKEKIGGTEKIQQLELFGDWIKGAQDVDPEDNVLGKLWQNLLVDIIEGKDLDAVVIEKMEKISANEALLLLDVFSCQVLHTRKERENYYLARLKEKDIVFQKNSITLSHILLLGLILLPSIYFFYIQEFLSFISLIPIALLFVLYLNYLRYRMLWKLTWIGKKICSYAPDNLKNKIS